MALLDNKKTGIISLIKLPIIIVVILITFFFVLKYVFFPNDDSYTPIHTTYLTSFENFAFDINAYFYEDMCIVRSIEAHHPSHYSFISAQYHFYPLVLSDGSIVYRLYDSNARGSDNASYMIITFYDEKQRVERSIIMSMGDVLDFSSQDMSLSIQVEDKSFSIHRAYLKPGAEIVFRMNSLE